MTESCNIKLKIWSPVKFVIIGHKVADFYTHRKDYYRKLQLNKVHNLVIKS